MKHDDHDTTKQTVSHADVVSDEVFFYLKCFNIHTQSFKTYRFNSCKHGQNSLAQFAKLAHEQGLSIVDTHISFIDAQLLFADIPEDGCDIDHMDVNTAEDGQQTLAVWQG